MPRVSFKHEDEVDGEPVGPVTVELAPDEIISATEAAARLSPGTWAAYDPSHNSRWVTLNEARALAAEHGVELEEG